MGAANTPIKLTFGFLLTCLSKKKKHTRASAPKSNERTLTSENPGSLRESRGNNYWPTHLIYCGSGFPRCGYKIFPRPDLSEIQRSIINPHSLWWYSVLYFWLNFISWIFNPALGSQNWILAVQKRYDYKNMNSRDHPFSFPLAQNAEWTP